jgi:hypothetical protein
MTLPPIPGWSTNPVRYLIWAGVPSFFALALMAAFWMRFDAPIWGAL